MSMLLSCRDESEDHVSSIFSIVNTLPEDSPKQIHVLDSAFGKIPHPGIEDRLDVYAFKCAFYQRNGDLNKAFGYADTITRMTATRINQPKFAKWHATALASKGDIYLALKDYSASFECYTRSHVIFESVSIDSCGDHGYKQRLAYLMYKQNKFDIAAQYFRAAANEHHCSNGKNDFILFANKQANLDNAGLCYSKMNRWDSAVHYYTAAIKYIDANEAQFPTRKGYIRNARAVVQGNLAKYYAQQHKFKESDSLYLTSLNVLGKGNDAFTHELKIEYASMLIGTKRLAEANALLDDVFSSLVNSTDDNNLVKYYRAKADQLVALGDLEGSNEHLKKYISLIETAGEKNITFSSVDVASHMEKKYQEALNETLIKDNRLKQLYLVVSILTGAIILIVSAFLLFNARRKQKLNRALTLRQERERISKDLHDDLGSSLTCLQLLVEPLVRDGKDTDKVFHNIAQISEEATVRLQDIVWMLSDSEDSVNALMVHLRVYMAEYIERIPLNLRLDFRNNGGDTSLSNLERRNILLVVKELFHNVVKHAKATTFIFDCSYNAGVLQLLARDNGVGFQVDKVSTGNGIKSITKRIQRMHGTIAIRNECGTAVLIEVPLSARTMKSKHSNSTSMGS